MTIKRGLSPIRQYNLQDFILLRSTLTISDLLCMSTLETIRSIDSHANNFAIDAITITELYLERWQIEIFSKLIKQLLHSKTFMAQPSFCLHADMDSHLRLPAAYHHEQAIWLEAKSSYNLILYRTNTLQKRRHPRLYDKPDESVNIPETDLNKQAILLLKLLRRAIK